MYREFQVPYYDSYQPPLIRNELVYKKEICWNSFLGWCALSNVISFNSFAYLTQTHKSPQVFCIERPSFFFYSGRHWAFERKLAANEIKNSIWSGSQRFQTLREKKIFLSCKIHNMCPTEVCDVNNLSYWLSNWNGLACFNYFELKIYVIEECYKVRAVIQKSAV